MTVPDFEWIFEKAGKRVQLKKRLRLKAATLLYSGRGRTG